MKKLYGILMAGVFAVPTSAFSQETISLTVASSHPTVVPWVGMIKSHFMAKTDEILAETGNYKIEWNEAFGGQLYKANATLNSVEEGITDIGWVFSFLEAGKLPLSQVSSYAPFSTNNPPGAADGDGDLIETNDSFRQGMGAAQSQGARPDRHRLYDIYTKPSRSPASPIWTA
jgi:TRAP-type mannitol/chloroaromatic compound transport system substrate-binding protein